MAAPRVAMRNIKECLRLKLEAGLSHEKIARALQLSKGVVSKYIAAARVAGLDWPALVAMDEAALAAALFAPASTGKPRGERVLPDVLSIHRELRRKGVTLQLLWEEYLAAHPQQPTYRYTQFVEHYRRYAQTLKRSMRQLHRAGEKLFIDYAGPTLPVVDPATGEVRRAHIFVAALGASNYTYACATPGETQVDWLTSLGQALTYFGGVPEMVVPDNLRSAVSKSHRYEPDINPSYRDLAEHYGVAVVPARARKPRDKAKAEVGVQVVERWILAALRNRQFFSLNELNTAIAALLARLNQRPFKKLPGSRQTAFDSLDRPAMRALPEQPCVYAEWKKARVHIDYHVEVDGHYYSVPYKLVKKQLEVRLTATKSAVS